MNTSNLNQFNLKLLFWYMIVNAIFFGSGLTAMLGSLRVLKDTERMRDAMQGHWDRIHHIQLDAYEDLRDARQLRIELRNLVETMIPEQTKGPE